MTAEPVTEVRMRWKGPLSKAMRDTSRYLCLEGAIRSGLEAARMAATQAPRQA